MTPEESPSGEKEGRDYVSAGGRGGSGKSKASGVENGKGKAREEEVEAEVRISMYVRLFEGELGACVVCCT